jgi:hypothetical protein
MTSTPFRNGRIAFALLAILTAANVAARPVSIVASHELPIARPAEMIAVPWSKLIQALPEATVQKLIVKDAAGHVLPYQVTNLDYDAKGIKPGFADLLFQYDFAAGERSATFTVEQSPTVVAPFPAKTYARFVPERLDDFAWENDRIGHRAYGPALSSPDVDGIGKEVLTASGIDVWVKRVRYPVIDRWYGRGNYHQDVGEGFDMYKTGATRGTGGTGIWDGKRLHVSANFISWKIIANGPLRTIFELAYAPWDANGVKVAETKRFTVDAGHNLDLVESSFRFSGPESLVVALGITRNSTEKGQFAGDAAVFRESADHTLVQWEVEATNGGLGEALIVPDDFSGYAADPGNQLILATVKPGRPLRYLAGAGWTLSGDFPTRQDWIDYVRAAAARARAPLTITLSTP